MPCVDLVPMLKLPIGKCEKRDTVPAVLSGIALDGICEEPGEGINRYNYLPVLQYRY
jgi:hypothetical protein